MKFPNLPFPSEIRFCTIIHFYPGVFLCIALLTLNNLFF